MPNHHALEPGLRAVVDRATAHVGEPEQRLVADFTAAFFAEVDDDELAERAGELATLAVEHIRFGAVRRAGETLVEVRPSPDGKRSMLLVVNDDAPFLVDTIRLALSRLGIEVFLMVHPGLDVERSPDGTLVDVGHEPSRLDNHLPLPGRVREAWTEMEVSRLSADKAADVVEVVRAAVADVLAVVGDGEAMRLRAVALGEQLIEYPVIGHTATECEQVGRLLVWLSRAHFVFLAAATYDVVDLEAPRSGSLIGGSEQQTLQVIDDSR
ncbi:MAG TPA: NAD-glutamate dehydrogenase, partial [Ilumatobacteraceae bacterium]|nr:NAD-glutamate dehydrogenase [Ilumatobacteraceae bacterium]